MTKTRWSSEEEVKEQVKPVLADEEDEDEEQVKPAPVAEVARYRLLVPSIIDGVHREAGYEFEDAVFLPGSNVEALNGPARSAQEVVRNRFTGVPLDPDMMNEATKPGAEARHTLGKGRSGG